MRIAQIVDLPLQKLAELHQGPTRIAISHVFGRAMLAPILFATNEP
jgi:hypothetical protein